MFPILARRLLRRRGVPNVVVTSEPVAVVPPDGGPVESKAAKPVVIDPLSRKLKGYFGDEVNLEILERQHPALRNSWRNVTISFVTFLIFIYCFAIQIWLVVRAAQAGPSVDAASTPGNSSDVPSSILVSVSTTLTVPAATRTVTSTRPTKTLEADPDADLYLWERATFVPEPSIRKRQTLKQQEPTDSLSALCLYWDGSQVRKKGAVANAFSVSYNLWVAFFIIILLFYEHKRLRFSRKAHSAAVVGMIEAWMAVDYLARGVEIWLILAAAFVFIASFFNLLYGLPQTHTNRHNLFSYLMSRPYDPSIPTAGKSYAVPSRDGRFLPTVAEAIAVLNRGIEDELRAQKASEYNISREKINKANLGPVNLEPYQTLPQTVLNPALLKGLSVEEKRKYGLVPEDLERSVVGGIMPFENIGEQYNPMEMLRGILRPTASDSKDGKQGPAEDPTEKLIRWKMMNELLKEAGGIGTQPQPQPWPFQQVPVVAGQPYGTALPMAPAAAYAPAGAYVAPDPYGPPGAYPPATYPPYQGYHTHAYAPYAAEPRSEKMENYLRRQQHTMRGLPAGAYSVYGYH